MGSGQWANRRASGCDVAVADRTGPSKQRGPGQQARGPNRALASPCRAGRSSAVVIVLSWRLLVRSLRNHACPRAWGPRRARPTPGTHQTVGGEAGRAQLCQFCGGTDQSTSHPPAASAGRWMDGASARSLDADPPWQPTARPPVQPEAPPRLSSVRSSLAFRPSQIAVAAGLSLARYSAARRAAASQRGYVVASCVELRGTACSAESPVPRPVRVAASCSESSALLCPSAIINASSTRHCHWYCNSRQCGPGKPLSTQATQASTQHPVCPIPAAVAAVDRGQRLY